MRKKFLSILIILLLLSVTAVCVTACKQESQLDTPQVTVNGGIVKWKTVAGATGYELRVNGEIVSCSETSFDLLSMNNLPSDRQFFIRVRAVNRKTQSEWCDIVSYKQSTYTLTKPDLRFKNGLLSWTADSKTLKVAVTVDGVKTELPADAVQYDLSSLKQDSAVTVQFVGDGIYVLDSTVASFTYLAASGKVRLSAPQNVRMDGYTLMFDNVYGADVYYLLDVTGVITTITNNRSDRTNKYLIKEVWAGDTSNTYADGLHADVKYFSKGSGTKNDPFLISSREELRYVDYYESTNQAMYYKLASDIAFTTYSPEEEEEYNNFYNLGSLSGVIDGDGHKLSNSVVYFRDGYSALFDSITPSGVIKNLVIDNANFRTWTNITNDGIMHEKGGECAILAYTNRGTISNVTVSNSYIYADRDGAAALVAINKGVISHCVIESSTSIHGVNEAGGIAIFNSGTIQNCINRADISGSTTIGGIVGRNNGTVTQCGNVGNITATTYAGGIVGYNYNMFDEELLFESIISQCYNYGDISVVSFGGGIAGKNGGNGINEVGVVSPANAGIISCYNTGAISGATSLGGIVGDNYGYHKNAEDLGVVNCYSIGEITVNTNMLRSTRVYLSLANCSWATENGALLYLYYWAEEDLVSWPGVRMTPVVINEKTYYYADISVKAEELVGVIFNRINPSNGDVWSQTGDIKKDFVTGDLLFKVNSSWSAVTISSSTGLVDYADIAAGGIAGYNTMINDCYYIASAADGNVLSAGIGQGDQLNEIYINGTKADDSACQIDLATLSTFAATLNDYADVWADGENGPILKWQKGD